MAETKVNELIGGGQLENPNLEPSQVVYALSLWLLVRFVEKHNGSFFAALSNGSVVRLSGRVTEVAFPIEESFDTSERNVRSLLRTSWGGFFALIEPELFMLDVEKNTERARMLSGERLVDAIRPLNGSPICFRNTLDFRTALLEAASGAVVSQASVGNTVGRKKVRNIAAEQYRAKYPEGHEKAGVSLSEAARKLGYDRKTLRIGLNEFYTNGERPRE